MRYFIWTTLGTILVLIIFFGYQRNFGNVSNLPVDEEQSGLNDQIVIKFSHVVAENTPKGLAASKVAELIEKKTNGRIRVEVYPNSVLYSDDDEFKALQKGNVEMIAPSFSKVTELVPEWQVLDMPYILEDYSDVRAVFTGKVGEDLLSKMDRIDVKGLALWSNGFKQMATNELPLVNKEDFEELRVRTMPSEMLEKQFSILGAKPISSSFDEVYSSLENHQIDAQENTLSNIYSKGFYHVQKYMTLSNHGFLGYAVMMNSEFWESLPKDLQSDVKEAIDEATLWNLQQSEKMNQTDLENIKRVSDIEIHPLSEQELAKWKKWFEPLYKQIDSRESRTLIHDIQAEIK